MKNQVQFDVKKQVLFALTLFIAFILQSCTSSDEFKLIPVRVGEKWQYIDKEGKIVINPQFSQATLFHEGLAMVRTEGEKPLCGYINEEGKFIINAIYVEASVFSEGMAVVTPENGSPTYIDKEGQIKFTLKDAEEASIIKEGLAYYSTAKDGRKLFGYVDQTGITKITPQFINCNLFSEGLAAVLNDKYEWGFIDINGTLVIPYQFAFAGSFCEGKAIVSDGKNMGYIDKTGKYVINPQFQEALGFSEGLAAVKLNDKWGFINEKGTIDINPQFDYVSPFRNGLAVILSNEKYGYIDKTGKIIINPQFDFAETFWGNAAFITSNEKIGMIDKTGKYKLNPQFDESSYEIDVPKSKYTSGSSAIYDQLLYAKVNTDFFSVEQVVSSLIPFISNGIINNITKNTTLKEVMNKFSVSKDQLPDNSYSSDFEITSQKSKYILQGTRYFFNNNVCVYAKDAASGNYTHYPIETRTLSVVSSYVSLQGKARENVDAVYEAIKKHLLSNGFTFYNESWGIEVYTSNNKAYGVNLNKTDNKITLTYPYNSDELIGYIPPQWRAGFPGENEEEYYDQYGDPYNGN